MFIKECANPIQDTACFAERYDVSPKYDDCIFIELNLL